MQVRYYQKEWETMPRADLEALQLNKLQKLIAYLYERVPFYKKRLDSVGMTPDKFKALSDLREIPYTTKEDIRDHYPYGLFATPLKETVRLHASSGTTGKPTVVGYTKGDLEVWSDIVARFAVAAGATENDIAQICFGYGLFTGALGLHYGLEKLGATVIPASSGNTEKQLMLMKDLGTTLMVATPSYALYMGEVFHDLGMKKEDFKLRLALLGSEGCTPAMRDKLEDVWGMFVTDNYGMSELVGPGVAGECIYRCGHHIAEDHYIPEVIDSKTGQPLLEGEKGELVFTTLSKEAFPLLRYRTRDLSSLDYSLCACGRTMARMAKVNDRADNMLKIKGVNVFPSQIESVLLDMPEIAPNYQMILTSKNYMDNLEVRVEVVDAALLERFAELEALQNSVRRNLHTVLGIEAKVTLVSPRTIERTAGKAKRIVDLRGKNTI